MGEEKPPPTRPCDYCAKDRQCFEVWRDGDYMRAQWLCVECIKVLRIAALKK